MTAALNIADQGFETIVVEKDNELGGNLKHINVLYPIQQEASIFLNKLKEDIKKNQNVQIFLNSKINKINGTIGKYEISILNSDHKIHDFNVGTIIVATGSQEFKPYGLFQYDENNKNILTQMELEKKLKSNDRSWLDKIRHVTTIMCAGARQKEGYPYCSNVCCSNTVKNMDILKKIKPELENVVLFRELHLSKKEFEEFASKRKEIAKYLKYDVENRPEITKIRENPERYSIKLRDYVNRHNFITFETDLVVLSTPMIPPDDLQELADMLEVPLDEYGFFIEAHNKLRPLDFAAHGIFVCGCAQWPKNVQDSISEANGAAGRASRFLSAREISTTKLELLSFMLSMECFFKDMKVNIEKCNGCGRCEEVCQFKAITLTDLKQEFEDVTVSTKKAFINPAICKGCGRCAATCRLKAIDPRHYDFKQISAIIDPYFLEKAQSEEMEGKPEVIVSD
jgi:heterodisulfide reductase subunit A